jgi:hypothetical protein
MLSTYDTLYERALARTVKEDCLLCDHSLVHMRPPSYSNRFQWLKRNLQWFSTHLIVSVTLGTALF